MAQELDPRKNAEVGAPRATIGDVLEQVAMFSARETVKEKDARAIESAEALATGKASGMQGGPADEARFAVSKASFSPSGEDKPTFGEVLQDVKTRLKSDKVVTEEDAETVVKAETQADPLGEIQPGHVAASMNEAATYNKSLEGSC